MKRTTAKRAIIGLLGTAAVGVTLAVAPTGPANGYPVDQGQDFAEHNSAGNWFRVCDRESDDHSVWAEFHDNTGPQRKSKPVDYDSADNCGRYEASPGVYLTNIRVVEVIPTTGTRYYGAWHGWPVVGN